MKTFGEIILEKSASQIRREGEAALKELQTQNKKESKQKQKSEYTEYLKKQFEFKKQKYEDQKRAQIENIKKRAKQQHLEKAKQSIAGIKKQDISDKDSEGTAYSKAIGNVGSVAAGVGGAAYHAARAAMSNRTAQKNIEAAKKKQKEKKELKAPGRPPKVQGRPPKVQGKPPKPSVTTSASSSNRPSLPSSPQRKLLPPYEPKLPPAKPRGLSLGQRARRNPELKARLISKSITNEEYSNWREEFLYEIDDYKETKSKNKKNIVDVMKGKNTIEINPKEDQVREEIENIQKQTSSPDKSRTKQLVQIQKKQLADKLAQLNKGVPLNQSYSFDGYYIDEEGPSLSVGRGEKLPASKGAGLTKKGRERYNRETGSNLKAPVTGKVKPGSEAAQRRKNFCSRSRSWKGERGLAARRRWKC